VWIGENLFENVTNVHLIKDTFSSCITQTFKDFRIYDLVSFRFVICSVIKNGALSELFGYIVLMIEGPNEDGWVLKERLPF